MTHTLSLEIPEEMYEPLVQTAKKTGQTVEELAAQWLMTAIQNTINDPVEKFIGAFPTNVPNWGDEHDFYLGAGQILVEAEQPPENNNDI